MRRRSGQHNGGIGNDRQSAPTYNIVDEIDEKNEIKSKKMNCSLNSSKKPKNGYKRYRPKGSIKTLTERHNEENAKRNGETQEECRERVESVDNASTSRSDTDQATKSAEIRGGESLAILLSQGLMSGDAEKIDSVLMKSDSRIISATLNELPITQILPLLKQIEFRFRNRKTLDVRCWARWVQYIISMHAPYLSTIGSLESELGTLYSWMQSRSAHMGNLYALQGKLLLLSEQIERRANPKFFIFQQPTVLFSEGTETASERSESDEREENESVASDDDWWEDDDIASNSNEELPEDERRSSEESDSEDEEEEGNEDEDNDGTMERNMDSNDEMDVN
uniref:Small-subunit processome Utp12 domain-containing protein n=1 Tax=Parascaris univalens TaxID=6257 RepID=A0A915CA89_PARUN